MGREVTNCLSVFVYTYSDSLISLNVRTRSLLCYVNWRSFNGTDLQTPDLKWALSNRQLWSNKTYFRWRQTANPIWKGFFLKIDHQWKETISYVRQPLFIIFFIKFIIRYCHCYKLCTDVKKEIVSNRLILASQWKSHLALKILHWDYMYIFISALFII